MFLYKPCMRYVSYLKNRMFYVEITEISRPEVFCKKVFLEISQNSQENTCARDSSLMKLQTPAKVFSY